MTTKEQIVIMQAYADGKKIRSALMNPTTISSRDIWSKNDAPTWDWEHVKYEVIPESKYRPFETIEEVEAVFGKTLRSACSMIILAGAKYSANGTLNLLLGKNWVTAEVASKLYTIDGHPAGVLDD